MKSPHNSRLVSMACASFLFSLAANPAKAALVLTLDDLSTVGIDRILSDDQLAGYLTSVGATTTVDSYSGIGYLTYIGSVGHFNVNVTTGVSKPVIGPGILDLNSINVSGGAGALRIGLTDTGFTGYYPSYQARFGGTSSGSVNLNFLYDALNSEFGGNSFFNPTAVTGAFSNFGAGAVTASSPYSLTIFADIVHTAAGQLTSFDAEVAPVPLPATIWLIGSGIAGLAFTTRRKTV